MIFYRNYTVWILPWHGLQRVHDGWLDITLGRGSSWNFWPSCWNACRQVCFTRFLHCSFSKLQSLYFTVVTRPTWVLVWLLSTSALDVSNVRVALSVRAPFLSSVPFLPLVVISQIPLPLPLWVSSKCFGDLIKNSLNVSTSPPSTGLSHTGNVITKIAHPLHHYNELFCFDVANTCGLWMTITNVISPNLFLFAPRLKKFCKKKKIFRKSFNLSARPLLPRPTRSHWKSPSCWRMISSNKTGTSIVT